MGMCANCGQYETLHEFKDHSGRSKYYCEDCYRMAKLFESWWVEVSVSEVLSEWEFLGIRYMDSVPNSLYTFTD